MNKITIDISSSGPGAEPGRNLAVCLGNLIKVNFTVFIGFAKDMI